MLKWDPVLGQIAVESGFITERQLRAIIERAGGTAGLPALGELLVGAGLVMPLDLLELYEAQNRRLQGQAPFDPHRTEELALARRIVSEGRVTAEGLTDAMALQLHRTESQKACPPLTELLTELGLVKRGELDDLSPGGAHRYECPTCHREFHLRDVVDGVAYSCAKCQVSLRNTAAPANVPDPRPPSRKASEAPAKVEETPAPRKASPPAPDTRRIPIVRTPPRAASPAPKQVEKTPARAQKPAPPPEEVDAKAAEALRRIEATLTDAAAQDDEEARMACAATCGERLTQLARWAERTAPGSRFLGRVYGALGHFHALHKRTRNANDALLAGFELGCPFDSKSLVDLATYFVADRCETRGALRLYASFVTELPFRMDEVAADDRGRIHDFLYEQAANM